MHGSRLIINSAAITLLLAVTTTAICQRKPSIDNSDFKYEPGIHLRMYRLNSPPPGGFEDFDFFILKRLPGQEHGEIQLDWRGNAPVGGRLETTNKTVYKFKRALLIFGKNEYERLEFTTVKVKNISFKFEGQLLKRAEREGAQYIKLRGVLSKYKGRKLIASAKLGFYIYSID